jgi:hypothetical protein
MNPASLTQKTRLFRGVSGEHLLVCAIATVVCTVLAIWAVISAPVSVPGVSGLYIAAAVYVPLALWFGMWGCIAGYLSCIFMGLYLGYSLDFVLVWALADFFEGFVVLVAYRQLKLKRSNLKKPTLTYVLTGTLVADIVIAAFAAVNALTEIFLLTFIVAIAILSVQTVVENRKTWGTWLVVGVFAASLVSGAFGVGALWAFGFVPTDAFSTAFFGWVFGDIMVLATIGTVMAITITPYVMKTRVYVRNYFT